jgi:transaldolase
VKLFVDSASLADIEEALERGFVRGVTTNPSILAKEERRDYRVHIRDIIGLLGKQAQPVPLSVEVFATEADEMVRQATDFTEEFGDYPGLVIKVPVGWDELRVIATLSERGVAVNATCAMSVNQAVMALGAGARYVSLFWGRIKDTGYDPSIVVGGVRRLMDRDGESSEIIVGSIRHLLDVNEALLAGAHIVTVPPPMLPKMCGHPKTDEAVHQFVTEFAAWMV